MNNDNITIWNITFDVDGKLYVLDEGKIGTNVHVLLKLLHDNISMNDIRLIDNFDVEALLEHEGFNMTFEEVK